MPGTAHDGLAGLGRFLALALHVEAEVATRALIVNEQGHTSLASTDDLERNPDGSVELYFAPERPEGVPESNWIQTIPDQSWFTLPRLYAPLEPILDKTWRWNDIEKVSSAP